MIEISGETIVRGFWVAILSGAMAYVVYDAGTRSTGSEKNVPRYRPHLGGYVLPRYMV